RFRAAARGAGRASPPRGPRRAGCSQQRPPPAPPTACALRVGFPSARRSLAGGNPTRSRRARPICGTLPPTALVTLTLEAARLVGDDGRRSVGRLPAVPRTLALELHHEAAAEAAASASAAPRPSP